MVPFVSLSFPRGSAVANGNTTNTNTTTPLDPATVAANVAFDNDLFSFNPADELPQAVRDGIWNESLAAIGHTPDTFSKALEEWDKQEFASGAAEDMPTLEVSEALAGPGVTVQEVDDPVDGATSSPAANNPEEVFVVPVAPPAAVPARATRVAVPARATRAATPRTRPLRTSLLAQPFTKTVREFKQIRSIIHAAQVVIDDKKRYRTSRKTGYDVDDPYTCTFLDTGCRGKPFVNYTGLKEHLVNVHGWKYGDVGMVYKDSALRKMEVREGLA